MLSALGLDPVETGILMRFEKPTNVDGTIDDFFTVAGNCSESSKLKITMGLRFAIEMFIKCGFIEPVEGGYLLSSKIKAIMDYKPESVLPAIATMEELAGLRINKVEDCSGILLLLMSNNKVLKLKAEHDQYDCDVAIEIDKEVTVRDMITLGLLPETVFTEAYGYEQMVINLAQKIKRYKEYARLGSEFT